MRLRSIRIIHRCIIAVLGKNLTEIKPCRTFRIETGLAGRQVVRNACIIVTKQVHDRRIVVTNRLGLLLDCQLARFGRHHFGLGVTLERFLAAVCFQYDRFFFPVGPGDCVPSGAFGCHLFFHG